MGNAPGGVPVTDDRDDIIRVRQSEDDLSNDIA
jgi:hypothetical protein